jgi:hypothetical protein
LKFTVADNGLDITKFRLDVTGIHCGGGPEQSQEIEILQVCTHGPPSPGGDRLLEVPGPSTLVLLAVGLLAMLGAASPILRHPQRLAARVGLICPPREPLREEWTVMLD